MRIIIIAIACGVLLTGCARYNWAPGPSAQNTDFEQQQARCRLMARHGGGGFEAAGSPSFVAGAAVGNAIGEGIRTQADFNDCMAASGWKATNKE